MVDEKSSGVEAADEGISDLRKLQLVELSIMKAFAAFCEQENLRYYMIGGTLLGAVRHKGFIPWDDDVDLCMPRPDYERFLELAPGALAGAGFTVESLYSDDAYRHGMAKVTSPKMRIVNRAANADRVEDAWIDVIPMDGFPSSAPAIAAHKARLMFWKVMDATADFDYVVDTNRDRGFAGNVALKCLQGFCRVVRPYGSDYHKVLLKTERALKRYPYQAGGRTINLHAARGFTEIFDVDWFGEGVSLPFEDAEFAAPADWKAVLTTIYGPDYMTPPPESERNVHNSEVLAEE